MGLKYIFADEAGCLTFNRSGHASRFYIICTVLLDDVSVVKDLIDLRTRLVHEGVELGDYFHASEDKQAVRDAVYEVLLRHSFSVHATIIEKSKATPSLCEDRSKFYGQAIYEHFKLAGLHIALLEHDALITLAALGTKKERAIFRNEVSEALQKTLPHQKWKTDFQPSGSHPCLQLADYCAWAIQKKWERNDERSYELIKDRIAYEEDIWASNDNHFY